MKKLAFLTIILLIAYWQRDKIKDKASQYLPAGLKKLLPQNTENTNETAQKTSPQYVSFNGIWPLHIYHKGIVVKTLQIRLNQKHNAGLKPDGYFGPATQKALIKNGYPKSLTIADYKSVLT